MTNPRNLKKIIHHATILKFGDLLEGEKLATNAKFQHNIFKITPVRPKNRECGYGS